MLKSCRLLYIWNILFLFSVNLLATPNQLKQSNPSYKRLGDAIITSYPTDKFDGKGTNWYIQQHSNGVIFVSNAFGLYSYDGANWRDHSLGENKIAQVRQFVIHPDGRIYVGGESDFGYFEAANNGELNYHSLLDQLPPEQNQISDVNNVFIYHHQVFFITPEQIMAYSDTSGFKIWQPETKFSRAWKAADKLFFTDGSKLKYFTGDAISVVPQLEDKNIISFGFVQALGNDYLIGTFSQGIYLWQDGNIIPWLDPKRKESSMGLYNSLTINQQIFAVNTIRNGVLFFNHNADLVYHLNTDNGLPINITLNMFLDDQQGLWLAQEGQLSRVQLPFELSVYTAAKHTIAKIRNFAKLNNTLYLSAVNGILKIDPEGNLVEVPGALTSTANILTFQNQLIIAGAKQCQLLDPLTGQSKAITETANCRDVLLSSKHPQSLLFITESSIAVSSFAEGEWGAAVELLQNTQIGSGLVEDKFGQIWSADRNGALLKFWFDGRWHSKTLQVDNTEVVPLVLDGKLLVASDNGLFYWDDKKQSLGKKVTWFHQQFGEDADAPYLIYKDRKQRVWVASREHAGYFTSTDSNSQQWTNYPVTASAMNGLRRVFEDGDVVWLGFDNGIVRYQPNTAIHSASISARISEIKLKSSDTPLSLDIFSNPTKSIQSTLEHDSLRVFFGLSNYLQEKNNQYRYRLNNTPWSPWSNEKYVDLGELSGDNYQLELQARDPQLNIYTATPQKFSILPPWYKSYWAYLVYALLALLSIIIISSIVVKIRTRSILQQQRLLETEVKQRTATIQQQADQLKQLDKAKSRFFANVSHEFRTPLTLAIGPLQELIRNNRVEHPQDQQHLKVALQNSQQMLSLVGQILDINRLESGEMPLAITQISITKVLNKILQRFEIMANNKQIKFNRIGFEDKQLIWFDEDHFNKIITNLLSNALKFSPENSTVTIGYKAIPTENLIKIWIQDEGPGISDDEKPQLFERFFQGKDSSNHLQPGTGIGLSMVKEIIQLHHGNVELKETNTGGCCFQVSLLLGSEHYREEHFVDTLSTQTSVQIPTSEDSLSKLETASSEQTLPIVLVVDDNQDLRQFIDSSISSSYQVIQASHGEEALALVESEQPDFIISDIMMPVMDGLELTKRLKQNPQTAHIPLLLLTAKSTKRETVTGLQKGADDYLSKPFDSSELIARIAAHLQQKRNIAKALYQSFISQNDFNQENSSDHEQHHLRDSFQSKFSQLVLNHLSDAHFDIAAMSESMNMERSTLFRKVKKTFGCTPNQYLKNQRMNLSLQMLKKHRGSVSEIAYAVGFQSLNYFSRSFRDTYQVAPSNYQNISIN